MQESDFNPPPGTPERLADGLIRILAPNPSPMTFRGTNTYLVGQESLAVIDPGPDSPAHLAAILKAIARRPLGAILVSHSHLDHSALARPLARATGATVLAYGDSRAGRSAVMTRLAERGLRGGGEGVDRDFTPDKTLADGEIITGADWQITAHWTPGHFGNHMCFAWQTALFTGDHVMGWASSLVSPPDGDLGQFMASCARLALRRDTIHYPGHGAPIPAPAARLKQLMAHRTLRENQILATLGAGPASAAEIAARLYCDVARALRPAAERNVFAHLIDLAQKSRVRWQGALDTSARFSLI